MQYVKTTSFHSSVCNLVSATKPFLDGDEIWHRIPSQKWNFVKTGQESHYLVKVIHEFLVPILPIFIEQFG
jgi:hypothetical protein